MEESQSENAEMNEPSSNTAVEVASEVRDCIIKQDKGEPGGVALLAGVAVIWVVELALGLMLILWLGDDESLENHPVPLLITALASGVSTFLVSWFFVCGLYRRSLVEGFNLFPISKASLLAAILVGIILSAMLSIVGSWYSTGDHLFSKLLDHPSGFVSLSIMVLILPIVEEFYYRGFLYPILKKYCGALAAIAIVTVWFALAHSLQSLEDLIAIPLVASAGAVFTVQRWWSGSLTVPLVTHWTYNFCLIVYTVTVE